MMLCLCYAGVCCVLCPVHCVLCPVHCLLCPVYCVLCPEHCVMWAVYYLVQAAFQLHALTHSHVNILSLLSNTQLYSILLNSTCKFLVLVNFVSTALNWIYLFIYCKLMNGFYLFYLCRCKLCCSQVPG
jgi:hypothetical protein